jgi:MSHA pilin protein MshD
MPVPVNVRPKKSAQGFTLVEIIIGIVVSAIALTLLTTLFWSQTTRSVEATFQIRAAKVAQALLDEIMSKRFDELSPIGGIPACDGGGCTAVGSFGADAGESGRADYDDVDDYQVYCADDGSGQPGWPISNAMGVALTNFDNFRLRVCVSYDGDYDGVSDASTQAKLIQVQVYPKTAGGVGAPIAVHAYRSNF